MPTFPPHSSRSPWRVVLALFLCALGASPARGAPDGAPPAVPSAAARAEQVISAAKLKDANALGLWYGSDEPDPWLVADEIDARGESATALELAKAAPRPTVAGLAALLEGRAGRVPDPADRAALATASAELTAGRGEAALAAATRPQEAGDALLAVRLAEARASALLLLRRFDEAVTAFGAVATAARALGWFGGEASALRSVGQSLTAKGDIRGSLAPWAEWVRLEERGGRTVVLAEALHNLGNAHQGLGEFDEAKPRFERAIELFHQLGDAHGEGLALQSLAVLHARRGEIPLAVAAVEKARALLEPLGDEAALARLHALLGHCHRARGDRAAAIAAFGRAIEIQERLGNEAALAAELGNLALVHQQAGEFDTALPLLERAIPLAEKTGADGALSSALAALGYHHRLRGEFETALGLQRRALAIVERLGDRRTLAISIGNLGNLFLDMGDPASALSHYDRSRRMHEAMGNRPAVAWALSMMGAVHSTLGDASLAVDLLERALELQEALGAKPQAVESLRYLAAAHSARGEHAEAMRRLDRSIALAEELGLQSAAMSGLGTRGLVRFRAGDAAGSEQDSLKALALAEAMGNRMVVLGISENLALAEAKLGKPEAALARLASAREESVRLGAGDATVHHDWVEGMVRFGAGDLRGALAAAERASLGLPRVLAGLGDEEGALARGGYAEIPDVGLLAAHGLGDVEAFARLLERGRATGMLETLGGRSALAVLVPADLRAAETSARHAVKLALQAYRDVAGSGTESVQAERRAALAAARTDLDLAATAIERDGRVGGALSAAGMDLTAVRASLSPSEAFVAFWMTSETLSGRVLALVVTPAGARSIDLGPRAAVEAACAALGVGGLSAAGGPAEDALRRLVLAPLALPEGVKRLLVSPDGALAEIPFVLLAPDREVAYVPTASVLGRLRTSQHAKGNGVLALGNPTVRAGPPHAPDRAAGEPPLASLPAAAEEAKAVGDVVRLGEQATVAGLVHAVAERPRWRAVHFACHGLVDFEHPGRSALALAPSGTGEPTAEVEADDGLLSARRVATLSIPADLVALSACETGRGKVVRAEGLLGLTRAFFLAGSSRVLVSLWKVDDRATRLLMETFYERWKKGGLGAAAALREAQLAVRDHEEEVLDPEASRAAKRDVFTRQQLYAAPRFWAAWVLWGLPE